MAGRSKPAVLCLSGLDPSGGAGIQADIETLLMTGSHCLPVITSLTVQDSQNVFSTQPVAAELLVRQVEMLRDDISVDAIKIGLMDSPETIRCVSRLLDLFPNIPIVADPVLKAGGGFDFGAADLAVLYRQFIVPRCTVLTPNTTELYLLSPESGSHPDAARQLCDDGCQYVLLTGTHDQSTNVINRLYDQSLNNEAVQWSWPRLDDVYHGSGCTLATALASFLAHGAHIESAAAQAQQFTWNALNHGWRAGQGQLMPDRFCGIAK
tara:strand:+ start:7449 stop:8246 length:798 start_codon:yes stop_codon:yes gene_type:complete